MAESLAQIAYAASSRTLDGQERVLEELRARTGVMLAASSLAASFLGRPADDANGVVLAAALAAFAVSIGASVYVLVPRSSFTFSLVGSAVYEELYELRTDVDEIYRRLAYDLDRFWEKNDVAMRSLFWWFRIAAIALAVEIVLLLAAVSGTLFL